MIRTCFHRPPSRRHSARATSTLLLSALAGLLGLSTARAASDPAVQAGDGPSKAPVVESIVESIAAPAPEVRGTWVTTTANTAIATPADTAKTMRRLREIGLNAVYVETWKNGYTQYPSEVLRRVVGVDRRPNLIPQDPSDTPDALKRPARDLLQETLIEAHRNGLVYLGWFEYGFMAAHKSTPTVDLWKKKPEWLSRDIKGSEIAPNGFVWMNPLHPEARRFVLDLVLEAIDKYDLDGVQLDDRIVWPYINMGYDDYTKSIYAKEHDGKLPPEDHKDPAWMRWRADKVNEFSKMFVQEIRARRPGIIISLSPAPYPWCWENYLLEWPKWAGWTAADALKKKEGWSGNGITPRWDEYIPQNYRFTYDAFEKTWLDQIDHMNTMGAGRQRDLIAGIRLVGDGKDSSWDQLKRSMDLARSKGNGGHVHWFSRGVLDIFSKELTEYYNVAKAGPAAHPVFGPNWRPLPVALITDGKIGPSGERTFDAADVPQGTYRIIARQASGKESVWTEIGEFKNTHGDRSVNVIQAPDPNAPQGSKSLLIRAAVFTGQSLKVVTGSGIDQVELLIDRRGELSKPRKTGK